MGNELPKGWKEVPLFDIAELSTGKVDANHSTEDGLYPFYTCASEPMKSPDFSFDDEAVIVPGNGANVGSVLYYNGKFQYYNTTTSAWVDTSVDSGNIYVMNMMPQEMQYIKGIYNVEKNQLGVFDINHDGYVTYADKDYFLNMISNIEEYKIN